MFSWAWILEQNLYQDNSWVTEKLCRFFLATLSHTIHGCYIYLQLVDVHGKCREIYHTWKLWVLLPWWTSTSWSYHDITSENKTLWWWYLVVTITGNDPCDIPASSPACFSPGFVTFEPRLYPALDSIQTEFLVGWKGLIHKDVW